MSDDQAPTGTTRASPSELGLIPGVADLTETLDAQPGEQSTERLICPSCEHTVAAGDYQSEVAHCENCGHSFRLERVWPGSPLDEIRIVGRFQLLDRVGRGSFGTVWRARDTQLDRVVAVKIPHHHALESVLDSERIEREARVAAQLRHPGIVRLYEILTVDEMPVLVSDFISGISLKSLLQIRRLTFRESADLIAQIAEALDHAHDRGLVHRDVKPANIMMEFSGSSPEAGATAGQATAGLHVAALSAEDRAATRLGKPIVVDFGLALRPETDVIKTIDGQIVGTPAYMSPEQADGRGHHVDRRSDIYSLGAVLYQLLCGELPFRGSTIMLIHQLLHEDPRPPRRLNDRIPRDLDTICMKALAKLPSRRYNTAGEMAADLRRYLRGEPCRARPVAHWERAWLWALRNRALATACALAAVLLAAIAIGGLLVAVREKTHADALGLALRESNYHLAENYLDRGLSLCERGEVAHGMLLLTRGLSVVPGDAGDLIRVIRANLAAWQENLDPLVAMRGPGGAISRARFHAVVAFSPDGKLAATRDADRQIQFLNGATGVPSGDPIDCSSDIRSMVFQPDGQTLAIACWDGKARFWNVGRGSFMATAFDQLQKVNSIAYSNDGKVLATGGEDGQLQLWDAATGRRLLAVPAQMRPILMVAFAPDDAMIVLATTDGRLELRSAKNGAKVAAGSFPSYMAAAVSPNGKWLATGGSDGRACIWDAAKLTMRYALPHTTAVSAVAFSPDSGTLLTGSADKVARLWDVESGERIGSAAQHLQQIGAAAFSPDGRSILTASDDGVCQLHKVRKAASACLAIPHRADVASVSISSDGRIALTGTRGISPLEGEVQFWDAVTGKSLGRVAHQALITAAVFSPDGQIAATASADQTATLVNVPAGKLLCSPLQHKGWVHAVAFSPDGKSLLTGCGDSFARLWEVPTGRYLDRSFAHDDEVVAVAVSPDNALALTASADRTARLWDKNSGRQLHVFQHQNLVRCATFNGDGTLVLTASMDRTARIWRVDSGEQVGQPLLHQDEVLCAAFSPDGKTVVTGSADQTAQLWLLSTTEPLGSPLVHQGPVYAAVYNPDGLTVATASSDGSCRLWDITTCHPVGPAMRHRKGIIALAFSPDGRRLITGGTDAVARIWELPPASVDASPARLLAWVQTLCGMRLAGNEALGVLAPEAWEKGRHDLANLGGSPIAVH